MLRLPIGAKNVPAQLVWCCQFHMQNYTLPVHTARIYFYAICKKKHHNATDAKADLKMMVKFTPDCSACPQNTRGVNLDGFFYHKSNIKVCVEVFR